MRAIFGPNPSFRRYFHSNPDLHKETVEVFLPFGVLRERSLSVTEILKKRNILDILNALINTLSMLPQGALPPPPPPYTRDITFHVA